MIRVGLIGYGYWGPNIARVINELLGAKLIYCADLLHRSLKDVKRKYPQVQITKNYKDILNDSSINAVFVATPTRTHFEIAKDCLSSKKHVFVEKLLAYSSAECKGLIKIAKEKNVKLMVGHTFIFNPSLCEGLTIENDVFIGHGVMFINDNNPTVEKTIAKTWTLEKVLVKKGAVIGSNSTILGGIVVGEGAVVGASAVVTKNIPSRVTVVDNPARNKGLPNLQLL